MAIEKKWPAVAPQLFTTDGGQFGVIKVVSAAGFKVKQLVVISANTLPTLRLQVKRVIGPDTIIVGDIPTKQGEQSLTHRKDLSAYTIVLGSYIFAEEQDKNTIKPEDIIQAVYRQEPGTTIGVEIDDQYGNPIDSVIDDDGINRFAVDAKVTIPPITVTTDLDALTPPTRPDPDNVLIAGSEDGTKTGFKRALKVEPDSSLNVVDFINAGTGVEGIIIVGTSAVEAKVGITALTNRRSLTIFNFGTDIIYWGYSPAVTTLTGTPIFKKQQAMWAVGDDQPVYLVSASAGNNIRATEGA